MTNALANIPAGFMPTSEAEIEAFINSATTTGASMAAGGTAFLKYSKGDWALGKEGDTFDDNKFLCVPNMPAMQHGFQCWKDGQLVDEIWVGIAQHLPPKSSLADHGPYTQQNDGWQQCVRLDMVILPEIGVEKRIRCQFNTASSGGRKAVGELLKAFGAGLRQNLGKVPVVEASSDSYKHSKYGKVHVPVLKIVEWRPYAAVAEHLADAPTGAPTLPAGEKPKSASKPASRKATAQPQPDDDSDTIPF